MPGLFQQPRAAGLDHLGDAANGERVQLRADGNVLAAAAFLSGLATHELRANELDYADPDYQVLISLRAVKAD